MPVNKCGLPNTRSVKLAVMYAANAYFLMIPEMRKKNASPVGTSLAEKPLRSSGKKSRAGEIGPCSMRGKKLR